MHQKMADNFSPAARRAPPHFNYFHLGKKYKSRRGQKYEFLIYTPENYTRADFRKRLCIYRPRIDEKIKRLNIDCGEKDVRRKSYVN